MLDTRIGLLVGFFVLIASPLSAQDPACIHQDAIVLDAHNDVLYASVLKGKDISTQMTTGHTDIPRLKEGKVNVQVFAVWADERYGKGKGFNHANQQIDALMRIIRDNPDDISLACTADEIKKTVWEGRIAAVIGIEGGHLIEERIDYLDSLHRRGARYLTLTWNNSLSWASSGRDEVRFPGRLKHKGLNDLGRQIIRRMNELGMVVDLSHAGRQTFFDAIEVSTKPVLVSHSNAYALAAHYRNLHDDQIRAVRDNGGVICVNFYSAFLDPMFYTRVNQAYSRYVTANDTVNRSADAKFTRLPAAAKEEVRPPLSMVIDHIDYLVGIAGIDHVGIGSDFDGIDSTPIGLDDCGDFPKITEALVERGYSETDIRKILGENVLRVLRENEGEDRGR